MEFGQQLEHRDQCWGMNSRSALNYHSRFFQSNRDRYMAHFSGSKSNVPLRNSHPFYWDGARLLLNVQGSGRETQTYWYQQREQVEQQLPCAPSPGLASVQ